MACKFEKNRDENNPSSNIFLTEGKSTLTIWRTKSLDDANPSLYSARDVTADAAKDGDATRSLHSSFDAALLLDPNGAAGKWFGSGITSDYHDMANASQVRGEFSGKKHMRQKIQMDVAALRKQARASLPDSSCVKPSEQFDFQSHASLTKGFPSVSKRRRMPSQTISSSVRKVNTRMQDSVVQAVHPRSRLREKSLSPTRSGHLTPQTSGRAISTRMMYSTASKLRSTGTKTVSTTVFETTEESDCGDMSSPSMAPFRFTSFPESLPRLNNPVQRQYPESICRRMSFGDKNTLKTSNQSREEDVTQNTSISSLSAEGCRNSPMHSVPFPKDLVKVNSHPSESTLDPHRSFSRCQTFGNSSGYSEDTTSDSLASPTIDGIRLDFGIQLSSTQMISDSPQPSFASVQPPLISRQTPRSSLTRALPSSPIPDSRLISSFNDTEATLTPERVCSRPIPTTPRDVLLHFPSETECSPIPSSDHNEHKDYVEQDISQVASSALWTQSHNVGVTNSELKLKEKELRLKEKDSLISFELAKQGQLRPMPDMSAFENATVSSRGDRSTNDSLTIEMKGMPTISRRLCPPTPVRTPAWASDGGTFISGRQNSLISTKVLLACPSHVLEGRSSLENSLLEEESNLEAIPSLSSNIITEKSAYTSKQEKPVEGPRMLKQCRDEVPRDSPPVYDHVLPTLHIDMQIPQYLNDDVLISFSNDFEVLTSLGSGAFADAYKVRSHIDDRLYAVKRNRRQFRGIRDRNMALAEVQYMQRLQDICSSEKSPAVQATGKTTYSLYLLFFYRAWQEDGYFFCQTELCCRDSCKELLDSIRLRWKSSSSKYPSISRHAPPLSPSLGANDENCSFHHLPLNTVWKICHDITAGLSHIHSYGLVHHDIKPSNILFVRNPRFGAMCKICDFGLAGEIGSSSDGQEGDTRYMPAELLSLMTRQPSADIFSLGLTLYEIASDHHVELPSEGPLWHQLRTNSMPHLPEFRGLPLCQLIKVMTSPSEDSRPTANEILSLDQIASYGHDFDTFLHDYVVDVERYDNLEEERLAAVNQEDQTPRNWSGCPRVTESPSLSILMPAESSLLSPIVQ